MRAPDITRDPPGDLQTVLRAIARTAARVCEASDALIQLVEGDRVATVARHGRLPSRRKLGETDPLSADLGGNRAIRRRRTIHIRDLAKTAGLRESKAFQLPLGVRTVLITPMLRAGVAIGAIVIRRRKVQPFTPKQVALLKTFADQAAIAIENARLSQELQTRNVELTESLDQQMATAEILRVISSSPTDVQPVFEIIAERATRLCDAEISAVSRFDGELIHMVSIHGMTREGVEAVRRIFPQPPSAETVAARVVRNCAVVHVADVPVDPLYEAKDAALAGRWRGTLGVPMLREGQVVGAIVVARANPGRFSDRHVELLKTFADQAVIAIENVRLFTELQTRNRELTEALEQQTATSEILRVISSSPTDTGPVFNTILDKATRLCGAQQAVLWIYEGDDMFRLGAFRGTSPALSDWLTRTPLHRFGAPFFRAEGPWRAAQIEDVTTTAPYREGQPIWREAVDTDGMRTLLMVPLIKDGRLIGSISAHRREVRRFSDKQVELVKTFADQAVIAIENVRLFTELQEKNLALTQAHAQVTEALDQQTATSEILNVISRSPTDVQPVLDAVARSAARLCEAYDAGVWLRDDEFLVIRAHHGPIPMHSQRISIGRGWVTGRAVVDGRPIHVDNLTTAGDEFPEGQAMALRDGHRTTMAAPLLREGKAIGAILIRRTEVRPFSDKHIALLKTFADQAVIAIENVRLFRELEARTQELIRSVGELRALGEVGQAVSSTLDLDTVLTTIVSRAVQLSSTDGGSIYEYDDAKEEFALRAAHNLNAPDIELRRAIRLRKGEGATGRMAITHEPVQLPDISTEGAYDSRLREALLRAGARAVLAVPILREDHFIGSLVVSRNSPGTFPTEVVELLKTFATQSALAIQNARLFQEIEDKSRQLEAASQHKSEFLANMSHELRTPLNAIIGFSEVLNERMFGDLNEKQEEYLKDIHASGQHLLSLINDILDLSKIEAGRMELELTEFNLPAALDNALTLVRERAGRRGIALQLTADERLEQIRADERKVRQVVLNLLSNAIKFTPEGGRIEVRAVPVDGAIEVSVSDNGVGIAPEDQDAIFEEFKQVGTSDKKVEGTGLGLALSRKFIELHGGRIWVKSEPGAGATFTFTLPVRRGE